MRRLNSPLIFVSTLAVASALAEANEHVSVSGFGNVSAIHSGTENYGFVYDLTKDGIFDEWDLKAGSALGLQFNASITDNLDAVVQAVGQDRINNDLDKTITWAFLRYQVRPDLTIRLGRMATPLYMLSEYRDVNFAYLWTKPITDFYANIPVTRFDGGDIAYTLPIGEGLLETRFYAGQSDVSIQALTEASDVELSPLFGTKLTYWSDNWTFSASAATVKNKKGEPVQSLASYFPDNPYIDLLWPDLASTLNDFKFVGTRFYYYSLGAHYESSDWDIQSELSYSDAEWPFFPDLAAGYVSVGRNVNDATIYGFVSKVKSIKEHYTVSPPHPAAAKFAPEVGEGYDLLNRAVNARRTDQETLGLGIRYNINSQLAIKGQIERTWLIHDRYGAWSYTLNGLYAEVPDHIDTLSVSLSFVF